MQLKKRIVYLLVGTTVAATAFYLFGTNGGKKELKRLNKTGSVTAGKFEALSREVARNVKEARKQDQATALKAFVHEVMAG